MIVTILTLPYGNANMTAEKTSETYETQLNGVTVPSMLIAIPQVSVNSVNKIHVL